MVDARAKERIAALAEKWSCAVVPEVVERIGDFFGLLLLWNARVNLTGAKTMDDLIDDHLSDSFALAGFAPPGANVVDVGAGGGLPGIPFALLRPDCAVTLVEPRAKRTAFLNTAQRQIGGSARVEVVRGRAEELPERTYRVAASRATFQPLEWLGVASRLLAPDGRAVVFASEPVEGRGVGYLLLGSSEYATGRGAARWAGAFVPRGTTGS